MSRSTTLAIVTCICFLASLISILGTAPSLASDSCSDVQAIFAGGSGQDFNGDESQEFFKQIKERLPQQLSITEYGLGAESQNGYQYPAVSIDSNWVKLRAKITAGYGYEYGDSVQQGMMELYYYLKQQYTQCPDTHYVLGGYSQGAQVTGHTLQFLSEEIRNKVTFTALFGDPKLYLPEGEGLPAPACFEWNLSPWRRNVENCYTSAGILEARKPYIPDDMKEKVGLWCLAQDYVCGSTNLPWEISGHDKYLEPSGPIDQAAQEIAEKLKTTFTYQSHLGEINTAPRPSQKPKVDVQILFVVDRTVNMQHDYPNYFLPKMRTLVESLPPGAAIGFDYYIGCWRKDDPARYDWALTIPHFIKDYGAAEEWIERSTTETTWMNSDTVGSLADLPYFPIEPGCDPSWELGIHAWRAMADFVQSYEPIHLPDTSTLWINNSRQRIVIPITNTPYTPNDTSFGNNNGLFTQATTSPPQTTVIPLVPDDIRHTFEDLEDLDPNTQVLLRDEDQIDETITEQFGTNSQVEARLTNTDYRFPIGTTVTFNASPSLVHDDTITKYEWDFNGDGTFDTTTTQSSVSHTYTSAPVGNSMTVRVTTANGLTSNASASVQIINLADLPPVPKMPQDLTLQPTGPTSVQFSWQPGDELADKWMVYINDVPLGYTEKSQTSIEVTDVRPNENTTFGVRAISSHYETSEMATITLRPHTSILSQNDLSSSSASTGGNKLSPANNIFEAFAKVFHTNGIAMIGDGQSGFRKPSPALAYYIIGGIVAVSLIFLVGLYVYKRRHTSH
jgi:hypothetical protein